MKKVLVVEDHEAVQTAIYNGLKNSAAVLQASGSQQARELFAANPDISIILMDFNIGDPKVNGATLTSDFRKAGYNGLIVAMGDDEWARKLMMKNGATHEIDKRLVVQLALRLLK